MTKLKNIMAYTNPIAIAMGVPFVVGLFLAIFGYRVGRDVKKTVSIAKNMVED